MQGHANKRFWLAFVVTATCASLPTDASAQSWEFEATADLGLIYTDNILLQPEGQERDEIVYTITPTFILAKEDDRLNADLRYSPQALFYQDTPEADNVYHSLDASITYAFVREALFLYASALKFQTILTPEGVIPTSNIPITANRVDSDILEVRPYWDQNLGFADILLEYTYIANKFDDTVEETPTIFTVDNKQQGARFELNNHERGEGIAWGLEYWGRRVEYDDIDALPWEFQRARVDLGYWFGEGFRLFVSRGIETPFDSFEDPSMDADFWEAGFQFTPNERLDLEVAAGNRSFGDTYRLRFSYRLRRGTTTITYSEEPSTRAEEFFQFSPRSTSDNLGNLLDRPTETDRFIRRFGEWLTTVELARSEITIRAFSEDREFRTDNTGVDLQDERLRGVSALWRWNLGDNSSLGLAADFARRQTGILEDELTRYAVDYNFQFTPRYGVVFMVQRSLQKGENSQFDIYTENQFWVLLRARFR